MCIRDSRSDVALGGRPWPSEGLHGCEPQSLFWRLGLQGRSDVGLLLGASSAAKARAVRVDNVR
eukprot:8125016-Alexandrium_andersonii.AAC.1